MGIVTIIFISTALAMDAFAISISSGMLMKRFNITNAVKLGLFFGIAQGLMPIIGYFIAGIFGDTLLKYNKPIAFILLVLIGGKMVYEAFKPSEDSNFADVDNSFNSLNLFGLAIATSIDALAVGISFKLNGEEIFLPAIIIATITFTISTIGVVIGKFVGGFMGKWAELLGGCILIIIGIKMLF